MITRTTSTLIYVHVVYIPAICRTTTIGVEAEPETYYSAGISSQVYVLLVPFTTPGYGSIRQMPGLVVNVPSEEHGGVHLPAGVKPPAIGSKLDIYPTYVSDVVNLGDELWVVRGDEVIAVWEIAARGKRV